KPTTIAIDSDLPYGIAAVAYRLPGYDDPDFAAGIVLADALDSRRGDLYGLAAAGRALGAGFDASALPKAGFGYAHAEFPPEQDIEAIKKVTVTDVNRVAKKYLINGTAVVALLTPRESGSPVASEGSKPGSESFAPRQTKPVPLPAWAKRTLNPLDVPASKVNPAVTVLANGLRLIVQPETISDTVGVYGVVKNRAELEAPKGKEGIDQILEELFPYGSVKLDRLAFQEAMDEIGAQASVGTRFSLQVLSDRFERGAELLADNLLHPGLPEAAFRAVKQRTRQAVAGQLQSPVYLSQRAFLKAIYPENDPTWRQATPDTVASIELEDVRAYYEKVFRPDLTTIVVIGKVTPEQAKSVVEKYFGEWKATGPTPETDLPPVPRNK